MYFPPRTAPLELSAGQLNGLRLSLNTPVVSIEELPVGPARAAIAIHEEPDGTSNLSIGVRSLRSGTVVLFSLEEDLQEHSSLAVGIDAALSFGESMGFLFDEDELEAGSTPEARSQALDFWLELMSPGQDLEASAETSQDPVLEISPLSAYEPDERFEDEKPPDDEVLLLEEVADTQESSPGAFLDGPDGIDSGPPEPAGERPTPVPELFGDVSSEPETPGGVSVPLSKFRHCVPSQSPSPPVDEARQAGGSSPAPKRTALGRLKLVKRRKVRDEGSPKPSVIRRLLSSF